MQTLLQDIRFGFRTLRKSPGFSLVVILTLALGIGANTAIFSFVDGILLKPLPYRNPEELVMVWEKPPQGERNSISVLNFLDWKKQQIVFTEIAAVTGGGQTLTGVAEPVRLRGLRVSAPYFNVFGIRAAIGRTFAPDEDQLGKERVVILSHRIWKRQFGADKTIVGRTVGLNGIQHQVVGVLPEGSSFDRGQTEVWIPLAFKPQEMTRDFHWLRSFARLKPGVSIEKARAEMRSIGGQIAKEYPVSNKGWSVAVDRLDERVVGPQLRRSLWVLMAAVGAVLLIGCVNIANLLLARGSTREREVAIRSSLGAGRIRLVRQFLTEAVVLSICGALFGLLIAFGMVRGLQALMPPFFLPSEALVELNLRVLGFTFGIAVLTGILFGTAPAIHASRSNLAGSLKEGGRSASGGTGRKRLRGVLVVTEVALAFVLLTSAGLLMRSFFALQNVKPGFDSSNVITMGLPVSDTRFPEADQLLAYQRGIRGNLEALPGVRSVALTSALPLQGWGYGMPYQIAGKPVVDVANRRACFFKMVTPSYFPALGIQIRKGRFLAEADRKGGAPVAVINETMAKRDFAGEDPLGQRILVQQIVPGRPELGPEIPWEIVGVIIDEKVGWLGDKESAGMYVPLEQSPNYGTSIIVRAALEPTTLIRAIQRQVHAIESNQALTDVRTMEQIKDESMTGTRLQTMLFTVFAAMALLLSGVGIYGVISYSVAQRTHELGIRSALGASSTDLVRMVLGGGMVLAAIGLILGGAGAYAATRTLTTLLFEIQPNDPPTFVLVAVALAAIALLACYLPARRATQIDPIIALRGE